MMSKIVMIPTNSIEILNPRVRNKKIFEELVESIRKIGLKRPITVRNAPNGKNHELICGQGRLEAFQKLGQIEIPAMVIEATRDECFVMSLVENLARRNLSPLELIREVGSMRERGYSNAEIAEKVGFSADYVYSINSLLEKGEERLLDAVERGSFLTQLQQKSQKPQMPMFREHLLRLMNLESFLVARFWPFVGLWENATPLVKVCDLFAKAIKEDNQQLLRHWSEPIKRKSIGRKC